MHQGEWRVIPNFPYTLAMTAIIKSSVFDKGDKDGKEVNQAKDSGD
jgi:hypothetical protein